MDWVFSVLSGVFQGDKFRIKLKCWIITVVAITHKSYTLWICSYVRYVFKSVINSWVHYNVIRYLRNKALYREIENASKELGNDRGTGCSKMFRQIYVLRLSWYILFLVSERFNKGIFWGSHWLNMKKRAHNPFLGNIEIIVFMIFSNPPPRSITDGKLEQKQRFFSQKNRQN
jgi:hypothetical protein